MATLTVGETGKRIRLAAGADMSSNTSITFNFTRADATTTGELAAVLGTTSETFDGIGTVAANYWAYYDIPDATLLTVAGSYTVRMTYNNSGASPSQKWIGETVTFTVAA